MAEYFNVTTNLGDAEIANAIATNTKIDITHIAFGDGNGSVPTPSKSRTALVREVHRQAVTKYERHATNTNWIVIETIIPSDIGGFTIREMGIIASGKLISHGSHAPFEKVADPSGVSEYRLKFTQNITDGNVVSITLDDSLIYATQAWVEENFIKRSDIVDNLTTNDSTKPVSAKQAKNLKESITAIEDIVLYAPIAWPSTIIPAGHLALMGQTISQAMYPKLFALYGSKLPDLRAYSIKGLDYGRGIDPGRTVLTAQTDAIQDFEANFYVRPYVPNSASGDTAILAGHGFTVVSEPSQSISYSKLIGDGTVQQIRTKVTLTAASLVRTSQETRVKNIAFLYIVKAG